jgi:hypothetical protein
MVEIGHKKKLRKGIPDLTKRLPRSEEACGHGE